jgi:hypothetical protein
MYALKEEYDAEKEKLKDELFSLLKKAEVLKKKIEEM